jgi:hypothetical protein
VRTTLSLDDDVASLLNKEVRHSGTSFKEAVNHYLRLGLMAAKRQQPVRSFKVKARPLGLAPGLSYDNIGELLEAIEGPAHK